jgi:hypothetical protein
MFPHNPLLAYARRTERERQRERETEGERERERELFLLSPVIDVL